jgi:hypothetical protein
VFFLFVFSESKRTPSDRSLKERLVEIDFPGTTLFVTSIVLLFIGLEIGGNRYSWKSYRVLLCFIFSVLCLAAFIVLQWRLGEKYVFLGVMRHLIALTST